MRGIKYYILTSLFFVFFITKLHAQEKADKRMSTLISGTVTDPSGKPIAETVVEVQEANRRTLTDKNGRFTIKASVGDVLLFNKKEFAGTQKEIADAVFLTISLQRTKIAGGEDDDVVIPFGIRKKRELNYSVSKLNGNDIPQVPTSNVITLFGGRIPGLYVQQTNTTPGTEAASLQIRGRSTYNSGNSPRVLVDGIPRDATELDINEIESVTVLKDAAALAWYGLNGANGVVLINTKRGSSKKMSLNFTSQEGINQRSEMIRPLSSFDYATLYNEALTNIGQPASYNQAALDAYQNGTNAYIFPNNNYIDSFLSTNSTSQRHVLSIDGGTSSFRYFTMLSFIQQNGLFKNTKTPDFNSNSRFQRLNFRMNLDYEVNKNLSVGLYAAARTGSMREPLDGGFALLNDLYNLPPNAFPIRNQNGSYGGTNVYQNNPLARLQERGYVRNLGRSLLVNVNAKHNINFIKGLSANILFSYDARGNYTSGLTKDYEVYDMTGATASKYRTAAPLNYVGANFNNNNRRNEIWAGLDYDRQLKSIHKINASVRFMRSVDAAAERLDFRGQQVSGRIDYGLMDRYFVGVVGSYAGSENFPPGKRYGFFPAVSAGWIISEEKLLKTFFKDNYLKLRASYGILGNGDIGGARLPYRTSYRAPAAFGYSFGTSFGATVSTDENNPLGNPNITWEKLNRFNIGTDLVLFNRGLSLSVDYFNDKRSNILTPAITPSVLGATLTSVNGGVVTSEGVESSLNFDKQLGKFGIGVNANYTYAKNNVSSVNETQGLPDYQSSIGHNTGIVAGVNTKLFYTSQGIFQTQAEINAAPKQQLSGTVVPGDIRYKDINGDGVINSQDAVFSNYTDIPSSFYGFGLNLKYGVFQLNGQFEGVGGRTIQIRTIVNSGPSNLNALSLDRWTPATAATAKYPRLAISDRGNNDANSDFWLRSGDFLKLRTLELSVSLSENIVEHLKVEKVKFFLSGYNLLTFKKLDIDIDPEMPTAGYGSAYPNIKTFSCGLNVQF